MRKWFVCLSVFCLFTLILGYKPVEKTEKLKWISLHEAEVAKSENKKPVLIDIYTDWCGWCKVMDRKTYSDKKVIAYLQDKFYTVKFNAETKTDISWSGKVFQFNPSYRANDFALYLTQGQLSFPTTVIIPADGTAPQAIPGYLTPSEIEIIVKYFGEGLYGKVSFPDYQKSFKTTW